MIWPLLAIAACTPSAPDVKQSHPHFVLGSPYQASGVWWYPTEAYDLDETGLATILPDGPAHPTTDGEVFDQTALAAAHPTLQLPAIVRLTNLENGLQVTVRVNDRGRGDPTRLIEMTRRAATLLGVPAGSIAKIRLQVLPRQSHAAADPLPGAPSLQVSAAPRDAVEVADLPALPGVRSSNETRMPSPAEAHDPAFEETAPPLRLPETVTRTAASRSRLMLRLDTFDTYRYADVQRAKLRGIPAKIVPVSQGRVHRFRVEAGPLPNIASADAALLQAISSGIPDARIVVE